MSDMGKHHRGLDAALARTGGGGAHDHSGPDWRCEACKPFAEVLRKRMSWASLHWGNLHDDAFSSLARAIYDSPEYAQAIAAAESAAGERIARAESLTETVRQTSRAISGTYPADLDPEAHRWRRCAKVEEEAGEVIEALLGLVGENPRKGRTHTMDDLIAELLDVANCALGAVDHLRPEADPVALLVDHSRQKWERLRTSLAIARTSSASPPEQTDAGGSR